MPLMYPKAYVECIDGVFDGQINDENSKAEIIINSNYLQTTSIIEQSAKPPYVTRNVPLN